MGPFIPLQPPSTSELKLKQRVLLTARPQNLPSILPTHGPVNEIMSRPVQISVPLPAHTAPPASSTVHNPINAATPSPNAAHPSSTRSSLKECTVCLEKRLSSRFPNRPPTRSCGHGRVVCRRCLRRYIDGKLGSGGAVAPKCPTVGCRQVLAYEDVKEFASPEAFARFDRHLMRKAVANEPGFIWCKNSDCGAGQIHTGGAKCNVVRCVKCGSTSCFKHDVPWHEGMTCKEYDRVHRGQEETASRNFVTTATKECPRCHAPIEKIAGCDHMVCYAPGGCGKKFSWSKARSSRGPEQRQRRWWRWW